MDPMGDPRIAVALTSSDVHTYLAAQLATIAAQTHLPVALVIGDDASGPGTHQVISTFSASALSRPHRSTRASCRFHRNAQDAFVRARELAEIVLPADHDDLWDPRKLARVAAAFAGTTGSPSGRCDATMIGPDDRPLGQHLRDIGHLGPDNRAKLAAGGGLDQLGHAATFSGATTAVRGTVFDVALPVPDDGDDQGVFFFPDAWLAVIARLLGGIVFEPEPLLSYRRHPGQMSIAAERAELTPASTSRVGQRRRELKRHWRRVRLVADRVRDQPDAPWDPANREQILALDSFLTTRVVPRGTPGRLPGVFGQLRSGGYPRFASGVGTAAFDVLLPPGSSTQVRPSS